jgi:hypothetical protein
VLFATRVDHTVGALRSLALRHRATIEEVAPGLMTLETDSVDALVSGACQELTSIETQEVRCLVVDCPDLTSTAVIARAMHAPSLAEAGARVRHADLVPLFENEQRCFYSEYQRIVTEGHRIDDLSHLERVFDYYRSRKCKVALDDLGAGYSSLNLLIRLQPDIVKLDKEIVQDLPGPVGSAVVAAVVDIVHGYGGLVLAECVETTEQADAASALGVDLAQGWLFGRPERRTTADVPFEEPVEMLRSGHVQPHLPDRAVAVAPVAEDTDGPSRPVRHSPPLIPTRMVERSTSRSG